MPAAAQAALGSNDYPYRGTVNRLDPWGFYSSYCTSFSAWRLSQAGIVFHGASLTGPNGRQAFFGNAGSWDRAAQSIGFAVDATPAVGSVAVWHGGEGGAWSGGHVAAVMSVTADGRAVVEEYNWGIRFAYGQRVARAPRYIHFTPAPASPPSTQPVAAPALPVFHVTTNLRQRSGPGTGFASVGILPQGTAIQIACQTRSASSVGGSRIWDRLVNGTYVSDYYVDTPAFNAFSLGIPIC